MCSLNNAINLYREEEKEDNNNYFMIVKKKDNVNIPLTNKEGNIQYFKDEESADIERIYYQPDYTELLKVIKV